MSQDNSRKALHAYVSDAAHDEWHSFAAEQGVSVSAVLEALAGELDADRREAASPLAERLDVVVKAARRIDAQRRRRTRS
jgi:hypothetical protein